MAASDFVISSREKIREGAVGANRPTSEAILQKFAANINSLVDTTYSSFDVDYNGYYSNSSIFQKAPFRIETTVEITHYQMTILDTGNGAANSINFNIYDDTGAFINTLFGAGVNRCLISGNDGSNVLVGQNLDTATSFSTNTAGHTFQFGVLNVTTLLSGWVIQPYIETFSTDARSIRFNMRLREQ